MTSSTTLALSVTLWILSLAGHYHAENTTKPCGQLPSGLWNIFHGIDLPSLDLYRFDGDKLYGLRDPLFELTCNQSRNWTFGKENYKMPDQVDKLDDTKPVKGPDNHVAMCADLECFRKKILSDSMIDTVVGLFRGGEFSRNIRFVEAQKEILQNKHLFGVVYEDTKVFRVDLAASDTLQKSLILSKVESNHNYSVKPAPYDKLVQQFGTHYVASALFGMRKEERFALKPEYYHENLPGNITDSLQAKFKGQLDKLNAAFQINTQTYAHEYGTKDEPWLLKVTLKPITELLPKGPLKTELEMAIKVHMTKALLSAWDYHVQAISSVNKLIWLLVGPYAPANIRSRILSCMADTVPKQSEVDQIGILVESLMHYAENLNNPFSTNKA